MEQTGQVLRHRDVKRGDVQRGQLSHVPPLCSKQPGILNRDPRLGSQGLNQLQVRLLKKIGLLLFE